MRGGGLDERQGGHHPGQCLGQRQVANKSNETAAIPELLRALVLNGRWVTLSPTLHTQDAWVHVTYCFTGGDVDPTTYQMIMRGDFRPD